MTIIGANVNYDRSFIDTEYLFNDTAGLQYYDTQSAWIVTRGFSNQQRGMYKAHKKDEYLYCPWADETATNGLDEVYHFYTGKTLDKGVRDNIVAKGYPWVRDNLGTVSLYCVRDLVATLEVFLHLYPEHRRSRHPVNLLSAKITGKAWLPLDVDRFPSYYDKAESVYETTLEVVRQQVRSRITEVLDQYSPFRGIPNDQVPIAPLKTKTATQKAHRQWIKDNVLATPVVDDPWLSQLDWTPISTGDRRGYPKWTDAYKEKISLGCRATFLLLSVTWRGFPVVWSDDLGWTYNGQPIPHPDGKDAKTKEDKRVQDLFVKGFEKHAESGVLSAVGDLKDTLARLMSAINWKSLRKRVAAIKTESPEGYPVCVPRIGVSNTATGRTADPMWTVASNPKVKRIGTELKSMIAPPSWLSIVGADVDGRYFAFLKSL